jgi:hypothetical protein
MLQKNRVLNSIKNSLKKIPVIIEKYNEMEDFEEEIELLKDYYQQVLLIEEESEKYIQALEERREELSKKKEIKRFKYGN